MKTNTAKSNKNRKENSGLLIRPEQLSTENTAKPDTRPKIDLALRRKNRSLDTERLLALLRDKAPNFFQLAEVVGEWVWITFDQKQPSEVTSVLAELGFHWNNTRQSWQHPCGTLPEIRADYDPREKYGSYFPAIEQAA